MNNNFIITDVNLAPIAVGKRFGEEWHCVATSGNQVYDTTEPTMEKGISRMLDLFKLDGNPWLAPEHLHLIVDGVEQKLN